MLCQVRPLLAEIVLLVKVTREELVRDTKLRRHERQGINAYIQNTRAQVGLRLQMLDREEVLNQLM